MYVANAELLDCSNMNNRAFSCTKVGDGVGDGVVLIVIVGVTVGVVVTDAPGVGLTDNVGVTLGVIEGVIDIVGVILLISYGMLIAVKKCQWLHACSIKQHQRRTKCLSKS